MSIKSRIRTIPDYPKKGIMFRDITTLLADPQGLQLSVNKMVERYAKHKIDKVVGIEARGFIFGAPLAHGLGVGFIPIRKKGKLPADTISHKYDLEYGSDVLEIHADAVKNGESVVLVDDLLATGGTAEASIHLIEEIGGEIKECCFVVDLPDIGGRARLEKLGYDVFTLCAFEGE
ncbi:MAG: Adenine phosphoribosyltransferase [Alphaproteobacteria bacterium MarineAlpha9_Bin7]|nr:MAG: Adenine phosphoribosyltransferase [Alphaproteobacteria bacterium MarineAlpha9_Bin7]